MWAWFSRCLVKLNSRTSLRTYWMIWSKTRAFSSKCNKIRFQSLRSLRWLLSVANNKLVSLSSKLMWLNSCQYCKSKLVRLWISYNSRSIKLTTCFIKHVSTNNQLVRRLFSSCQEKQFNNFTKKKLWFKSSLTMKPNASQIWWRTSQNCTYKNWWLTSKKSKINFKNRLIL